jgi:dodecin
MVFFCNFIPTLKTKYMAVLKVIEVLSSSETSWEDATQKAVAKAAQSLKNIRSVYVQEHSAQVKDNKVTEFRVNLKLTFEIE